MIYNRLCNNPKTTKQPVNKDGCRKAKEKTQSPNLSCPGRPRIG